MRAHVCVRLFMYDIHMYIYKQKRVTPPPPPRAYLSCLRVEGGGVSINISCGRLEPQALAKASLTCAGHKPTQPAKPNPTKPASQPRHYIYSIKFLTSAHACIDPAQLHRPWFQRDKKAKTRTNRNEGGQTDRKNVRKKGRKGRKEGRKNE